MFTESCNHHHNPRDSSTCDLHPGPLGPEPVLLTSAGHGPSGPFAAVVNPLTNEPGFSVPSWTCQHRCCPCCWPGLRARRRWWLCRAWVFIAVLYTSLAPSHSGWGSCHFDVVPVSRPASGLHMEGRASEPAHAPHPVSPLLLLRSCSQCQHLPDSVFPPGALHLEGLGNLGRQLLGRYRKPWHLPAFGGEELWLQ